MGEMELQFGSIPTGKERILLVNDDENLVISVRNMLQRFGYEVTGFTDAREALKVFSEKPSEFDLVITDHMMPHGGGEKMAEEMLRIRSGIPIVLCTGNIDSVPDEKLKERGLRGVIVKPFTLRECAEFVRRVLDKNEPGEK